MMDSLRNQGKYEYEELQKLKSLIEKSECFHESLMFRSHNTDGRARWSDRLNGPKES